MCACLISVTLFVSATKYNHIQEMKCIGERAKLFIQPGSKICDEQITLLGDDIKYIDIVDCFSERDSCDDIDISLTPAWEINKQRIYKLLNVTKLKEKTNC